MNKKMLQFCNNKRKDPDYHTTIHYYNILAPIVVMLGPNGTGKSTSIHSMIEELNELDFKVISYSTTNNDIVKTKVNPFKLDPNALAAAFLSEGERMDVSLFDWMDSILLKAVLEDNKDLWIFIDEADSGLSIDKIYKAFQHICFIIKEETKRGRKIHLVISANSYELAEYFNQYYELAEFIWVPTNEYIELGSYKRFKRRYIEYFEKMKELYGE